MLRHIGLLVQILAVINLFFPHKLHASDKSDFHTCTQLSVLKTWALEHPEDLLAGAMLAEAAKKDQESSVAEDAAKKDEESSLANTAAGVGITAAGIVGAPRVSVMAYEIYKNREAAKELSKQLKGIIDTIDGVAKTEVSKILRDSGAERAISRPAVAYATKSLEKLSGAKKRELVERMAAIVASHFKNPNSYMYNTRAMTPRASTVLRQRLSNIGVDTLATYIGESMDEVGKGVAHFFPDELVQGITKKMVPGVIDQLNRTSIPWRIGLVKGVSATLERNKTMPKLAKKAALRAVINLATADKPKPKWYNKMTTEMAVKVTSYTSDLLGTQGPKRAFVALSEFVASTAGLTVAFVAGHSDDLRAESLFSQINTNPLSFLQKMNPSEICTLIKGVDKDKKETVEFKQHLSVLYKAKTMMDSNASTADSSSDSSSSSESAYQE